MFNVKLKSSLNELIIPNKTIINFGQNIKNIHLNALESDPKGKTREDSNLERLITSCEVCESVLCP